MATKGESFTIRLMSSLHVASRPGNVSAFARTNFFQLPNSVAWKTAIAIHCDYMTPVTL